MKQYHFISVVLMIITLASCQDTQLVDSEAEFIVFGHFNGYCAGEACVDFYKVTGDDLLESNIDDYTENGFYPFNDFYALSADKFNQVKDLGDYMPQQLWLEFDTHIGQADVSDVGSLYFEIKKGAEHRYWVFENGDFDMPQVYSEFMYKIREKITIINQ